MSGVQTSELRTGQSRPHGHDGKINLLQVYSPLLYLYALSAARLPVSSSTVSIRLYLHLSFAAARDGPHPGPGRQLWQVLRMRPQAARDLP